MTQTGLRDFYLKMWYKRKRDFDRSEEHTKGRPYGEILANIHQLKF